MKQFSALLLSCALAASLAAPALAAPDYTLEFPGHTITKETLSFHGAPLEEKTVRVVHMKPGDVLRYTDNSEYRYLTATFYILFENDPAYALTTTIEAPNETCTTAHILTFLWRAMGSPEPTGENPFTDVTESNYYYKAALWAHEKELVSGNVFTASAPCTRGQTMLFLYLLAGSPAAEPTTFTDVALDSVYNRAISWAVTEGITTGKTADTFDPDGICTRGNIVTFLYRALAE